MARPNYSNLGSQVTSRDISWLDMCMRAWGSEFNAPDHGVYVFSGGRRYDSTDRNRTGIYGVIPDNLLEVAGQYPDMFNPWQLDPGGDTLQWDGTLPTPLVP